ncbi:MAG: DUF4412 domain-containing protein [Gemmatimonadales bacterium]
MMRAMLVGAVGLVALVSVPLSAQQFEGTIVTQMFNRGKPAMEMVSSHKGGKSRIDMQSGRESGYSILDLEAESMMMVMPSQKMYMVMAFKGGAAESKDKPVKLPKIEATGKSETIAGHQCDHYLVTSDDDVMDICAAKGLGFFGMAGRGSGPMGRSAGPSIPLEYRQLADQFKDGFQPLKVEQVKGSTREPIMEVKSIEKKTLDAAMFEVPAGYKKMDMGGLPGRIPGLPRRP